MSDSDSSSDESSGDGIEIMISNLESSDYDGHLKIIAKCKKEGELDFLRQIRSKFAEAFPLTEDLWLEWIEDEKKLCESEEDHEKLVELFEKGAKDYLAPKLWLEYIQYAIRWLGFEDGIKWFRSLCERAIQKVGLDPENGGAIWEVYRETELMIESEEKNEKVSNLFKRQCSLPIYQLEETYKEFKKFNQGKWKETKSAYDKAVLKLKEIEKFESEIRQLEKNPKELLDAWREYIQHELKLNDPVRIEFLYERATSKLCLTEALWEEYIQWARQIKSPNLLNIVTRATRNCTWCARLWVTRLKVAETQGVESAIINDIKDKALVAIEGSRIQDYISILKTYILFFKRKLQQETTDENKDGFRTAIRTAIKYIELTLGNSPGLDEQIVNEKFFFEKFAARVESSICGEIERARSKWQKLLKTGAIGRDARNWCEFAKIEIDNDEQEKARKIYHQGVHFATENLDDIYENARDFELLYGSVEQVDELELKIERKKENILKKAEREAFEKEKAQKRARNDRAKVEKKGQKQFQPMAFVKQVDGPPGAEPDTPPRKKRKDSNQSEMEVDDKPTNGNSGFNQPFAKPAFKAPLMPPPPMMTPPKLTAPKTKKDDKNKKADKSDLALPQQKHAETDEEKSRTIFISNIKYDCYQPEKKIRDLLLGCGEIEAVRLVKKGALFRGYAYVTFVEKGSIETALLRDRNQIEGRPAFITKHVDKDSVEKKKDFKFNDGKEHCRVFCKGFKKDISRDEIMKIFEPIGTIVDIRLPETREGRRKEIFYVEFGSGLEATKANLTLHGKPIGWQDRPVQVEVSNPPKRGKEAKEKKEMDISKTAYGTPKSKFNLVPRMIPSTVKQPVAKPEVKPEVKEKKTEEPEKEPKKSVGMSNADFRAKFFK